MKSPIGGRSIDFDQEKGRFDMEMTRARASRKHSDTAQRGTGSVETDKDGMLTTVERH